MNSSLALTTLVLVSVLAATAGCGDKNKAAGGGAASLIPNYDKRDGFGCLQGVVLDGFTGQRFDLASIQEPDGIYVLLRGKKLRAQFHRDDPNLKGEYYICDIPVEGVYPVFANVRGYLPFESTVQIVSTRAIRTPSSPGNVSQDVPIPDPMQLTNFRIFPKASGDRPLNVTVRKNGVPLEGAFVDLQPLAASSHFAFDGVFANTTATRLTPTRKTADSNGLAAFLASDVAFGGRYRLIVTPKPSSNAATYTQDFTLGISGADASDGDHWEMNVDVASTAQTLAVVSCSASSQTWNETGTISMVFNRSVALARGNDQRDDWTASLSGSSSAALVSNTAANNASEHVSVSISSDGRILSLSPKSGAFSTAVKTPNYATLKSDSQNADVDLVITYLLTGIKLDLLDDSGSGKNSMALSAITGASSCNQTRFFQEYK